MLTKAQAAASLGWQLYVLINGGITCVTFANPVVRYGKTNASRRGQYIARHADVRLSSPQLSGVHIRAAAVDFLTVKLSEQPVATILSEISADTAMSAPLFDGSDDPVSMRCEFPDVSDSDTALVILSVDIAAPLDDGGRLEAWTISQVISRMSGHPNGLAWRSSGLIPLQNQPGYLGWATSDPAVDAQPDSAAGDRFRIAVPVNDIEALVRGDSL